ncbi:hypothetical protein BOX15_Mlig024892g1, partial [Macrostomum lignano]
SSAASRAYPTVGRYFANRLPPEAQPTAQQQQPSEYAKLAIRLLRNCAQRQPIGESANQDGGLYVGSPGIGYACLHVLRSAGPLLQPSDRDWLLTTAGQISDRTVQDIEAGLSPAAEPRDSMILGAAGCFMLAAEIAAVRNQAAECVKQADKFVAECSRRLPLPGDPLGFGSDELFVGRAGCLLGLRRLLQLGPVCESADLAGRGRNLAEALIQSTVNSGLAGGESWPAASQIPPPPLRYRYHRSEYLGAAHGLGGVLFALLAWPGPHLSPGGPVQASVDWLISVGAANGDGNVGPTLDEANVSELVHWCHGSPGLVHLYARAHRVWGGSRYLQAVQASADNAVWQRGLLRKGPGICHGVAGSGYAFLLLHRLLLVANSSTWNSKYLHRARQFAQFMLDSDEFRQGARRPDCPYSLFEGWAGTACFYADLASPELAAFPLFDAFD